MLFLAHSKHCLSTMTSKATLSQSCLTEFAAALCLQIITPFSIYFNARFIYQKWELWRLLTNFMFFGSLGELCVAISLISACILHHCQWYLEHYVLIAPGNHCLTHVLQS